MYYMIIPSTLQKLILDALSSVHLHPSHDLNLGYRHAIWATFGDNENGHRRRAILALKTVRYVLPIWNKKFPYDDRPEYILNLAEKMLAGTISVEVAASTPHKPTAPSPTTAAVLPFCTPAETAA